MVSMEMGKGGRREKGDDEYNAMDRDDSINLATISVEESEELSRIVNAIAEEYGCEIISYCIYGSKVAGYARPDSDYDILLVLKDYKDIIKYVYVRDGAKLNASLLIVDGKALLRDAERAMLGEFVAGRLLHPYLPLYNGSYLNDVETIYKKRVIVEEYGTLLGLNPLIATDEVSIPLEYFLFSKIKKRAKIYPHALYSYVKTYTGSHASRNMEISRRGFMRALRELEQEGIVEVRNVHADDGKCYYHIILKDRSKGKGKGNNKALMKEMLRGAFAWLVHSYAARRTLNFFREEAVSKLNRRKEVKAYTIPPALDNPSILLKVNEGIVADGNSWLDMVAESLGFRDGYSARFTSIGDKHAATSLCTLEQEVGGEVKKKESIVIKYYTNMKMAKWIALNVWLAGIRRYDISPEKRMMNEYIGVRRVRALGINTPEVVALSFGKRLIAFKYVDGIPLSSILDKLVGNSSSNNNNSNGYGQKQVERVYDRMEKGAVGDLLGYVKAYGTILGIIHANGFILGDTKPSNVLVVVTPPLPYNHPPPHPANNSSITKSTNYYDGILYITDFEQFSTSTNYDDMAWDIACFLYYSLLFKRDEDMARMFVRAFLEGYAQHGSSDAIARAAKSSYFLPFYPAMVLGIIKAVREEIRAFR
jgi:tRNA A-37 threonylcarbamoyl transferase component Bud32/predicted nucleotidyltransferase